MASRILSGICIGALMLAGCDTVHGIRRSKTFGEAIDIACVRNAVAAAGYGEDATYRESENASFGVSPHWGAINTTSKIIAYDVPGTPGANLHILSDDRDEDVTWSQYYHVINRSVPRAVVDALRPAMLMIEREASARCGLDFTDIKEWVNAHD